MGRALYPRSAHHLSSSAFVTLSRCDQEGISPNPGGNLSLRLSSKPDPPSEEGGEGYRFSGQSIPAPIGA